MRSLLRLIPYLAVGLVTGAQAAAVLPGLDRPESFRWAGRVACGQTVTVEGVNGSIHAASWDGDHVEVIARKSGDTSANDVRIEVTNYDGGIAVRALYPEDHRETRVEFTVRIPAGVRFSGRTVNGEIRAESLRADVEAYAINGPIHISTTGSAQARTVNGSIHASLGAVHWNAQREFSVVNGSIEVGLSRRAGVRVHASTIRGGIASDFHFPVRGGYLGKTLRGVIGTSGPELKLTAVNGNIVLRQNL